MTILPLFVMSAKSGSMHVAIKYLIKSMLSFRKMKKKNSSVENVKSVKYVTKPWLKIILSFTVTLVIEGSILSVINLTKLIIICGKKMIMKNFLLVSAV